MDEIEVERQKPMNMIRDAALRTQLLERRQRLQTATVGTRDRQPELQHLLEEVDAALEKMDAETFGICETCHDSIENERLLADVNGDGQIEICNAGHCLPLHVGADSVARLESNGLPLGLFADGDYTPHTLKLAKGDSLVLYSDGLSESFDGAGKQYGVARLADLLARRRALLPRTIVDAVLGDLNSFCSGSPRVDDLTLMAIRRNA